MRSVSSLYPYIYYICMSLVHLARLSYATIVPIAFRPVNYYPFRICCGQALSFGCLATYPFKCLLLGHALEIGRFAVKRRCCKVFGACSPHKLIFVSVEIWFPLFLGFFVDFLCLEKLSGRVRALWIRLFLLPGSCTCSTCSRRYKNQFTASPSPSIARPTLWVFCLFSCVFFGCGQCSWPGQQLWSTKCWTAL